jgi:DNA-binding transcriptional ArsR family regulator
VLENDVLFRAREMALQGVDTMFTNLTPMMQYLCGQLLLDKPYKNKLKNKDYQLGGRGLQLVPAMLGRLSYQIVPEYQPMIIYRARGAGLWYAPQQPDTEKALVIALGEGKARLLSALKTPAHTTELARKLGITAGAVSQQLGRLSEAGLVQAHRSSNKVYYRLSPRGEKLLILFTE